MYKKKNGLQKQIDKMQIALKNYKKSNPLFEISGLAIKGQ